MENENTTQCYWNRTWLYHASGAKVEVALPFGAIDCANMIAEYLKAGFTVYAPEGTEGLDRMNVISVIRGQVTNNGVTTDRIYMYADFGLPQYQAQMTVYLNTPEDRAAFEAASHLKVADLPIVKGKASPARESGDYERLAHECQFAILRKKVNVTAENPKGNWEFVRYVGNSSFNAVSSHSDENHTSNGTNAPTPQNNGNSGTSDDGEIDYEKEALAYLKDKGVSIITVMRSLNIAKGAMPSKGDKDGWSKLLHRYAEFVAAQKAAS